MNDVQKAFNDNVSRVVTRKELQTLLGFKSYSTAKIHYRTILDALAITNRDYLTVADLMRYGVI